VAKLTTTSPLNGYDQPIGDMRLREIHNLDLTALAVPHKGASKLKTAIKAGFDLSMPTPVKSTADAKTRLLMTQPDQVFAMTPRTKNTETTVRKAIGDTAYITDQTDAWVVLELSGPSSRAALERICQVDLDANVFKLNQMARSTMEHMGSIVIRNGKDSFLLMSGSSSAASFLHAVELSAQHVS
jgi:sarcosine oxidase subunit gamma